MASPDSIVPQFKRVMLKISGEALMGDKGFGLNPPTVERIAREVKSVHELGVEICNEFYEFLENTPMKIHLMSHK